MRKVDLDEISILLDFRHNDEDFPTFYAVIPNRNSLVLVNEDGDIFYIVENQTDWNEFLAERKDEGLTLKKMLIGCNTIFAEFQHFNIVLKLVRTEARRHNLR